MNRRGIYSFLPRNLEHSPEDEILPFADKRLLPVVKLVMSM